MQTKVMALGEENTNCKLTGFVLALSGLRCSILSFNSSNVIVGDTVFSEYQRVGSACGRGSPCGDKTGADWIRVFRNPVNDERNMIASIIKREKKAIVSYADF